jgi:hypothetical protein
MALKTSAPDYNPEGNSLPVVYKFHTFPRYTEIFLNRALDGILAKLGQERLKELLSCCLRELVVNACKANMKRVYFREKGFELTNDRDYKVGMRSFKPEALSVSVQHFHEKLKVQDLHVKVSFQSRDRTLIITVRNNVAMTRQEQIRVQDCLARSGSFTSLAEAWGFPEPLVDAIRYHHEPTSAPEVSRDIIACVYLANAICDLRLRKIGFDELEPTVLRGFGIETESQITVIEERLAKAVKHHRVPFLLK